METLFQIALCSCFSKLNLVKNTQMFAVIDAIPRHTPSIFDDLQDIFQQIDRVNQLLDYQSLVLSNSRKVWKI